MAPYPARARCGGPRGPPQPRLDESSRRATQARAPSVSQALPWFRSASRAHGTIGWLSSSSSPGHHEPCRRRSRSASFCTVLHRQHRVQVDEHVRIIGVPSVGKKVRAAPACRQPGDEDELCAEAGPAQPTCLVPGHGSLLDRHSRPKFSPCRTWINARVPARKGVVAISQIKLSSSGMGRPLRRSLSVASRRARWLQLCRRGTGRGHVPGAVRRVEKEEIAIASGPPRPPRPGPSPRTLGDRWY